MPPKQQRQQQRRQHEEDQQDDQQEEVQQQQLPCVCTNENCEKHEFADEYLLRDHSFRASEHALLARKNRGDNPPCKGPRQSEIERLYRFPFSVNRCDKPGCAHVGHTPTHLKAHRKLHDCGKMELSQLEGKYILAPFLRPCQTVRVAEGHAPNRCCGRPKFWLYIKAARKTSAAGFRAAIEYLELYFIDRHMKKCHADLPGDLKCPLDACPATFHTQTAFLTHAKNDHDRVVFKCPDPACGEEWKIAELKKNPEALVQKIFYHIRHEHTMLTCPHCEYSTAANKRMRATVMKEHFTYENLVEDVDFSEVHLVTAEERQRCMADPTRREYAALAAAVFHRAAVPVLSRVMEQLQPLADLCDPIRIYRDYKDDFKSVKVLFDAIQKSKGRNRPRAIVVPDRQDQENNNYDNNNADDDDEQHEEEEALDDVNDDDENEQEEEEENEQAEPDDEIAFLFDNEEDEDGQQQEQKYLHPEQNIENLGEGGNLSKSKSRIRTREDQDEDDNAQQRNTGLFPLANSSSITPNNNDKNNNHDNSEDSVPVETPIIGELAVGQDSITFRSSAVSFTLKVNVLSLVFCLRCALPAEFMEEFNRRHRCCMISRLVAAMAAGRMIRSGKHAKRLALIYDVVSSAGASKAPLWGKFSTRLTNFVLAGITTQPRLAAALANNTPAILIVLHLCAAFIDQHCHRFTACSTDDNNNDKKIVRAWFALFESSSSAVTEEDAATLYELLIDFQPQQQEIHDDDNPLLRALECGNGARAHLTLRHAICWEGAVAGRFIEFVVSDFMNGKVNDHVRAIFDKILEQSHSPENYASLAASCFGATDSHLQLFLCLMKLSHCVSNNDTDDDDEDENDNPMFFTNNNIERAFKYLREGLDEGHMMIPAVSNEDCERNSNKHSRTVERILELLATASCPCDDRGTHVEDE